MNALLWRKYMNANNQLPAVGTTVYAIAKNNSTFKLEVVEGTMESISENGFKVSHRRTGFITDVYLYPMHAWRQECFQTKNEADVGLALLLDQQSGDGSRYKLAAKVGREMPTPPGKVLAAKLNEQHLSSLTIQKELGLDDNEYYKFVCGLIPMNKAMAEKLGEIIKGADTKFWVAAEVKYRLQREALIKDLVKEANRDA